MVGGQRGDCRGTAVLAGTELELARGMTSIADDPRDNPAYVEAMSGLDHVWRQRTTEYFIVIADDGFVLANNSVETGFDEEEASELRLACSMYKWPSCRFTNCLGECTAGGCACSRSRNELARDNFLKTIVQQIAAASAGQAEVSYASLGSGFLRFDFTLIECLLAAGVPLTAVHLVDTNYDPGAKGHSPYRVALAQFAAWFTCRGIDIYAHASVESFAFRVRQANTLPHAVLQIDCSELTWVFDSVVKPMLEEVLQYEGVFCSLTSREGAASVGASGSMDAWGESPLGALRRAGQPSVLNRLLRGCFAAGLGAQVRAAQQ